MIMKMKTPLVKALDAMSCIPFIQDICDDPGDTLTIAGVKQAPFIIPKLMSSWKRAFRHRLGRVPKLF